MRVCAVERVCTGAGCVCWHMQTRSSCCVPPVAPNSPSEAHRNWGSGSGGRGLPPKGVTVLSKLLLTQARATSNIADCTILCSFFLLQHAGLGLVSAVFQAWPQQRNSNVCYMKPLNCTNTPLPLNRALFSSYVLQPLRDDNRLSISRQKTLYMLIHLISAELCKITERFRRVVEEKRASSFPGQIGRKPTASSAFNSKMS